jgi:hypothetical protein
MYSPASFRLWTACPLAIYVLSLLVWVSRTSAQDNPRLDSAPAANADAAQHLEFIGLGRAVHSRAQLGSIMTVTAAVRNTSDKALVAVLIGRISGQTGEEDRRKIVVPAKRDSVFDLNLRILSESSSAKVEAVVTLSVIENGREILLRKGDEPISRSLVTSLTTEPSRTAAAMGPEPPEALNWRWPPTETFYAYEMVVGTRVDSSLSRICMNLENQPLPIALSDWTSFDVVVIGDPDALKDGASTTAIQQYLLNGGRVWIMLDRVDSGLVEPLFDNGQQCVIVDTVEMNHFLVDLNGLMNFTEKDRTVVSEKPLVMKRVIQSGGRVTHSTDGWPMAIWYKVGKGELLLTTLDAKGWLQERTTQNSPDETFQSNFSVPLWGGTFSNNIHAPRPELLFGKEPPSYPLDRIGNPIVSRQLVSLVLCSFCGVLGLVGLWRWMVGELRWMGLLAPAIGIVASIPMLVAAQSLRQTMPNMVSILQLVEFGSKHPGIIREKAAVFTNSNQNMELTCKVDGYATPSPGIASGIRRLIVDDFQSWRMTNEAWPSGTWRYSTESSLTKGPFEARASFTSKGVNIELPQEFAGKMEDIVVCQSPGIPTLVNAGEQSNQLLMDGSLPAGGDRWTTAALVNEEQLRRAAIYRNIFEEPGYNLRRPPSRVIYGWSGLYSEGPQWSLPFDRRGAALLAIPLVVTPPKTGEEIFIPHSMIDIVPPVGGALSSIYNSNLARWLDESNLDTRAGVIFELPGQVVPMEISKINVDLNVKAPKRKVRLYWTNGEKTIEIMAMNEPSIPWQGTIDDPLVLKDMMDGNLELRIEVLDNRDSASQAQGSFITWQLKHFRISVNGRTLPSHRLANSAP